MNIEGVQFKVPDGLAPSFLSKPAVSQDAKTATVQIDIAADPSPSLHWTKDGKELLNVDKVITRMERKGGNRYTILLDIKVSHSHFLSRTDSNRFSLSLEFGGIR